MQISKVESGSASLTDDPAFFFFFAGALCVRTPMGIICQHIVPANHKLNPVTLLFALHLSR